jgi:hypothetical protein
VHAPSFGSAPSGQQEETVPPTARHAKDACNERSAASTDAPPATMMGATRKRMIEENSLRNMIDDNQASICEITLRGVCIHINIQEEFSFLKL